MHHWRKATIVLCSALLMALALMGHNVARAASGPQPEFRPTPCSDNTGDVVWKIREDEDANWASGYMTSTSSDWYIGTRWNERYDTYYNSWCPGIYIQAIGEVDEAYVPMLGFVCEVDQADPTGAVLLTGHGWVNGNVRINDCYDYVVIAQTPTYWDTGGEWQGKSIFNGTNILSQTQVYSLP